MPVQTSFGRFVATIVETEFNAAAGARLLEIDEPAHASYIKVIFEIGGQRVMFKIAPERHETETAIRDAVRRHIDFSRRKRKTINRYAAQLLSQADKPPVRWPGGRAASGGPNCTASQRLHSLPPNFR